MKMVDKMIKELHDVVFGVVLSKSFYVQYVKEGDKQKAESNSRAYFREEGKAHCLAMACIHVFGVTPQYINKELKKSFSYLLDNPEYSEYLTVILNELLEHTQYMTDHEND